jgi:choline/glycine/proline betaine transport protein
VIYALVTLGLALFSFNRGLPLTFRSVFWPLFGERVYGWPGHLIELFVELYTTGSMVGGEVETDVSTALFETFQFYPLAGPSSVVGVLLVVTFFLTSSDSGSLAVDHLTSDGKHDTPVNQRVFWAISESALAAVLLIGGGLGALQTASITTGLPFAVVLLLTCYTTWLGLRREYEIHGSQAFADWMERVAEYDDTDVAAEDVDFPRNVSPGDD